MYQLAFKAALCGFDNVNAGTSVKMRAYRMLAFAPLAAKATVSYSVFHSSRAGMRAHGRGLRTFASKLSQVVVVIYPTQHEAHTHPAACLHQNKNLIN